MVSRLIKGRGVRQTSPCPCPELVARLTSISDCSRSIRFFEKTSGCEGLLPMVALA